MAYDELLDRMNQACMDVFGDLQAFTLTRINSGSVEDSIVVSLFSVQMYSASPFFMTYRVPTLFPAANPRFALHSIRMSGYLI